MNKADEGECVETQPPIAIGLEPPKEPWWTLETPGLACQSFQTRLALSPSADEPHRDSKQARAKRLDQIGGTLTAVGWTSRHKNLLALRRGEAFFLDILFYRTQLRNWPSPSIGEKAIANYEIHSGLAAIRQ